MQQSSTSSSQQFQEHGKTIQQDMRATNTADGMKIRKVEVDVRLSVRRWILPVLP